MKLPLILRIYLWLFLAILVALSINLFFFSDFNTLFINQRPGSVVDFGEGWKDKEGGIIDIDEINTADYPDGAVFTKKLPQILSVNDEFCFISNNSNVQVFIDGKLSYEFIAKKNLTGMGYGRAYHTVNMGPEDSGAEIKVAISSVFDTKSDGRIGRVSICEAPVFRAFYLRSQLLPFLLSVFITISGILIIILRQGIPKNQKLPYNLVALGASLTLAGIWLTGDTGVLQMIFGHVTFWRGVEYLLPLIAIPPAVSFAMSFVTVQKGIFVHIAFIAPYSTMAFLVIMRYVFDIGMEKFGRFIYTVCVLSLLLIVVIIVDNILYCRRNNIVTRISLFHIGTGALILGTMLDVIRVADAYGSRIIEARGYFMRIGISVLVVLMLIRITMWWSKEQASIARDRFVNKILQYSLSSTDSDTKINLVMEYLGSQLHADRAYIFEDAGNGLFNNTYEWCAKGVSCEINNLQNLPYDGVVDAWYEEYRRNSVVLIYDIEAYKNVSLNMYNVLKPQGIKTLVTVPLEVNGKYIGFFGVDNPPADAMNEIREVLRLLTYFISQLILEKQYEDKLVYYSYYDTLTGVRNRRALAEFEQEKMDRTASFGYIMCDINGLKTMNDTHGHEAGDALLQEVAGCLSGIFGNDNVYRVGGDEFAVYDCVSDKDAFASKVDEVKKQVTAHGHSVSIGFVYNGRGEHDFEKIKEQVDALMYDEKRKYYEGKRDRRSRRSE